MINVLYICTDWHKAEGSSLSLLNLINATRNEVNPIVLLSHQGEVEEMFHNNNIETIVSPFFYLWEKPKKNHNGHSPSYSHTSFPPIISQPAMLLSSTAKNT